MKIQTDTLDFRRKTLFQNGVFLLYYKHNYNHNYNHISRYPVFAPLEEEILKQFHISDTLEWCNGTIDIAPEDIFGHGEPVHDENGFPVAAEEPIDYEK